MVGGIERTRCASLQNEAHTLRRAIADWGSHSLGRRDSNWLTSFRFLSIKAVQKSWLPMGAPRISKSGVEQHKISGWRSCLLSNWHFLKLMRRPFEVLSPCMMSLPLTVLTLVLTVLRHPDTRSLTVKTRIMDLIYQRNYNYNTTLYTSRNTSNEQKEAIQNNFTYFFLL